MVNFVRSELPAPASGLLDRECMIAKPGFNRRLVPSAASEERYLLVANGLTNDVSIIDVAALKVIKLVQVGESPWDVAILPQ